MTKRTGVASKHLNLNTKILKQNPLILAEFNRAFSETQHDLLNGLLHIMQNVFEMDAEKLNLFTYNRIADRRVAISAADLKELGKFGVNANQYIFDALKQIRDTSAVLRNFVDIDGRRVAKKTVSIIDDVRQLDRSESPDSRQDYFEIQFNEWFLIASTRQYNIEHGNYTSLPPMIVPSIVGKHAKKLYEILEMQQGRNSEFCITMDRAAEVFDGLSSKDPFSKFSRIIDRNADKVKAYIPFEHTPHKKDKLISFKITHPSGKK